MSNRSQTLDYDVVYLRQRILKKYIMSCEKFGHLGTHFSSFVLWKHFLPFRHKLTNLFLFTANSSSVVFQRRHVQGDNFLSFSPSLTQRFILLFGTAIRVELFESYLQKHELDVAIIRLDRQRSESLTNLNNRNKF